MAGLSSMVSLYSTGPAHVTLRFRIPDGAMWVRFDKVVDWLISWCAQGNKGRPSWMMQGVTWSSGKSSRVGLKVKIDPNYLEPGYILVGEK
jgi:hypothetical protein